MNSVTDPHPAGHAAEGRFHVGEGAHVIPCSLLAGGWSAEPSRDAPHPPVPAMRAGDHQNAADDADLAVRQDPAGLLHGWFLSVALLAGGCCALPVIQTGRALQRVLRHKAPVRSL